MRLANEVSAYRQQIHEHRVWKVRAGLESSELHENGLAHLPHPRAGAGARLHRTVTGSQWMWGGRKSPISPIYCLRSYSFATRHFTAWTMHAARSHSGRIQVIGFKSSHCAWTFETTSSGTSAPSSCIGIHAVFYLCPFARFGHGHGTRAASAIPLHGMFLSDSQMNSCPVCDIVALCPRYSPTCPGRFWGTRKACHGEKTTPQAAGAIYSVQALNCTRYLHAAAQCDVLGNLAGGGSPGQDPSVCRVWTNTSL